MNIIVIVADTLRRDHLGCYGNKIIHTPHLDEFARKAVQFNDYYATSFPTMPARADLFTGKFTFTYLGWAPLPREEVVLAQVMSKAGYKTMGVVDTPFFLRKEFNYDRGFNDFIHNRGQRNEERPIANYERRYEEDYCAPRTIVAAERWLERHYKDQFFLYIDMWDPHEPWDPPAWYIEQYNPGYDGRSSIYPCYGPWQKRNLKKDDIKLAHDCYCGEVSMVDHWVGHLLDKVKSMNLLDDTVILFTSDHGFYFGEHGLFGKAVRSTELREWEWSPLYHEIARIPLLIHVPGLKHRQVKGMVSTPDLMPTILDLAGVEIPDSVHGVSRVPMINGKEKAGYEFVVTSMGLYEPGDEVMIVDGFTRKVKVMQPATITTKEWSLLYSKEGEPIELYNLGRDPDETENVSNDKKHKDIIEDLHHKFVKFLEQCGTDEHYLKPRRHLYKL